MENTVRILEELICQIEKTIYLYHRQQDYAATHVMKNLIHKLSEHKDVISYCISMVNQCEIHESELCFTEILSLILKAQKNMDNILLADLLEIQLKDMLCQSVSILYKEQKIEYSNCYNKNKKTLQDYQQELLYQIEMAQPIEGTKYLIEPCNNGAITLKLEEKDESYYLCSNVNPQKSALEFAEYYSEDGIDTYYLWGFELGYLSEAILEKNPYSELCVIESDPYLVKIALEYRDLKKLFRNKRFTLKIQVEGRIEFTQRDGEILLPYAPAIRHIQNVKLKRTLENYYMKFITVKEQRALLNDNFKSNNKKNFSNAMELKDKFRNKEIIYIGGGPSLDMLIPYLKQRKDKYIVICAGTVAGKLMREGITPEYAIITDPLPTMVEQINGNIDFQKTQLLFLSTASKAAVDAFDGKKYIIYQRGFPLAENAARKGNKILFETGGSVSTTAIDIMLQFQCCKIILMGMDLAYTDNKSHASDTAVVHGIDESINMRMVDCITGGKVPTAKNLDIYRIWIEQRILGERQVEIVNVSNGAIIHGATNISCKMFIKEVLEKLGQ